MNILCLGIGNVYLMPKDLWDEVNCIESNDSIVLLYSFRLSVINGLLGDVGIVLINIGFPSQSRSLQW